MKSKRAREAAEVDDTPVDTAEAPVKKRKVNGDGTEKKEKSKDKKKKGSKELAAAGEEDGGEVKAKKQKKEDKYKQQKESRRERKDKKKDLLNLPGDAEEDEEEADGEQNNATNGVEKKSEEKPAVNGEAEEEKKKKKKDKKSKKDKKEAKQDPAASAAESNGAQEQPETNGTDAIDLDASAAAKQDRHIVFVGNLPYTATVTTISAHFAALSPVAVRCLKNKGDDKPCRGIAFVEFAQAVHMRTCLDKFHHSEFNDGVSAPRKINVELTAGGGGKTKQRQDKIHAKNEKLNENRAKRIEREKQAKEEGTGQQANTMEDNIHPSRRGRVPGMAY